MRKPVLKLFAIIFSCFFCFSVSGQNKFLAMERPGHIKRVKFPIGTTMKFKIKGDSFYSEQTIDDVYGSTVVLSGNYIALDEIVGIKYKSESVLLKNQAYKLPLAAIVLLGLSAINYNGDINDEDDAVITEGALIGASVLVGVGIVGNILLHKSYNFKGRNKLKIIDTRINVQ